MTPVRVRGKRSAMPEEKWSHRNLRRETQSRTSPERGSSVVSSSSEVKSPRRRQKGNTSPHLSRLEQLPTEILQTIFEFSVNPDLPLASPRLASQLNSRHLYHELFSRILRSVIDDQKGSAAELKNAMRVMNSKFVTWDFFKEWLLAEFESRGWRTRWHGVYPPTEANPAQAEGWEKWTWSRLRPAFFLLPPEKLLNGPFTEDKVRFLNCMTCPLQDDPAMTYPLYFELAREGLEQAIAEGVDEVFPSFWRLGLQIDTALLRQAVIHAGCKENVVRPLLMGARKRVDLLDPDLWAWAHEARENGDNRGPWLISQLKMGSRKFNSSIISCPGRRFLQ